MPGASEFFELAKDFGAAPSKVAAAVYESFKAEGELFAEDWRDFARETSGEHGKWYPDSITSETLVTLGVHVTTGPESGRKQGSMGRGFEFGSRNQPPHLDGLRALPIAERRLEKTSGEAVEQALP